MKCLHSHTVITADNKERQSEGGPMLGKPFSEPSQATNYCTLPYSVRGIKQLWKGRRRQKIILVLNEKEDYGITVWQESLMTSSMHIKQHAKHPQILLFTVHLCYYCLQLYYNGNNDGLNSYSTFTRQSKHFTKTIIHAFARLYQCLYCKL